MALTSNHVNNEVIKFRRTALVDFLRKSRFDPFMGADSTSVIVRMNDLAADGKEINVANSWDLGDDSRAMPEGYHFGAVTDALGHGVTPGRLGREVHGVPVLWSSPFLGVKNAAADYERLRGELGLESMPEPPDAGADDPKRVRR